MKQTVTIVRLAVAGIVVSLAGCAVVAHVPAGSGITSTAVVAEDPASVCAQRFAALDTAIESAGLRDAEARPVAGFPYLRSSRLLRSYRDELALPAMRTAWVARMRSLDQTARRGEIGNFGTHRAAPLLGYAADTPAAFLLQSLDDCGRQLVARDLADPQRLRALLGQITSEPLQAPVGPTYLPVADERASALSDAFASALQTPPQLGAPARVLGPDAGPARMAAVGALVESRRRDALGLPVLTADVERRLLETFAPVLVLTQADTMTQGASRVVLRGSQSRPQPGLDTRAATVYGRVQPAREGGRTTLELVYCLWFPATPDGSGIAPLYLRVTLDTAGTPQRFDAMRGGARDLLVVPIGQRAGPDLQRAGFALPPPLEGERLRVWVDSDTRDVTALDYTAPLGAAAHTPYTLLPDTVLSSLPVDEDGRRRASLYRADGSLQGGAAAAGNVRQWGHQSLAHHPGTPFVGRYFDSPLGLATDPAPRH